MTIIQNLGEMIGNHFWIKREDLIPISFGGNKARKACLFFQEIEKCDCDCVVTYGTSHSNHCRVIANMAAARNMKCFIIGPVEVSDPTFNSRLMNLFDAEIENVPIGMVHDAIENKLEELRNKGHHPYFIPGGGHGNIGTEAYVQCYDEIIVYEQEHEMHFDYVFFASGTGTTHAGLVCGQLLNKDNREIVGISIARKNPRGREVVLDSIREYLCGADVTEEEIQKKTVFVDDYTDVGYGKHNDAINCTIKDVMCKYGIPLDSTYTGKAFYGMQQFLIDRRIEDKNILFIHTGGTPLFFDDVSRLEEK